MGRGYARQRALERMGWRFWRCWGSNFILDPESCMADLVSILTRNGIEPIGGTATRSIYTEHRVVGPAEIAEETASVQVPAMIEETLIAEREGVAQPVIGPMAPEVGSAEQEEDRKVLVVEPGDRVLISYNDEPTRQYTLTLSKTQHDPSMFVINTTAPLAQALMGWGEDDEVEIPAGGTTRVVTILKIDRQAQEHVRQRPGILSSQRSLDGAKRNPG
jgi:hypothetical protein